MSESAELLAELVERGATLRSIGDAIGRDSSLLSQVARGRKPGNNLTGALRELRDKLDGGAPPERVRSTSVHKPTARRTSSGEVARVRRRTVYKGETWDSGRVGKQAARNGARGLASTITRAAETGRRLAVRATLRSTTGAVWVVPQSPKKGGRQGGATQARAATQGKPFTVDAQLDAQELAARVRDTGGDVSHAVLELLAEHGSIGSDELGDEDGGGIEVLGVEVRTW